MKRKRSQKITLATWCYRSVKTLTFLLGRVTGSNSIRHKACHCQDLSWKFQRISFRTDSVGATFQFFPAPLMEAQLGPMISSNFVWNKKTWFRESRMSSVWWCKALLCSCSNRFNIRAQSEGVLFLTVVLTGLLPTRHFLFIVKHTTIKDMNSLIPYTEHFCSVRLHYKSGTAKIEL